MFRKLQIYVSLDLYIHPNITIVYYNLYIYMLYLYTVSLHFQGSRRPIQWRQGDFGTQRLDLMARQLPVQGAEAAEDIL